MIKAAFSAMALDFRGEPGLKMVSLESSLVAERFVPAEANQ